MTTEQIQQAADNYIGHPYEVDEGYDVSGMRKAFIAGAECANNHIADAGEMISKDDLLFELNYLYVELNELYDKEACQREGRVTCKASKLLTPNERRQRSQGYKSGLLTAIHLIKNRFNQLNNDERKESKAGV